MKMKRTKSLLPQTKKNQEIQNTITTLSTDSELLYKQIKEIFPEPSDEEISEDNRSEEMGDVAGPSTGPSNVAEPSAPSSKEEEDIMEDVQGYIYNKEERKVLLQRPNLCPGVAELIRIIFERKAQESAMVFTNIPIRRILDISK